MEWPGIIICLLTYKRTQYTIPCVESICQGLKYSGELGWYIADDGSGDDHMSEIFQAIHNNDHHFIGWHSERIGPGPSWSKACQYALQAYDYIFWLEDDWTCRYDVNIDPYIRLLIERQDVGMVRLGRMAVGLEMTAVGHNGIHYMDISKKTPYCYSGNPSIRHRRHFDAYGFYSGDPAVGPGDNEIYHDQRVRSKDGPAVWWPVDIGGWGAFDHIGTDQSY
jgi:hypothetical protein